MNETRATLWYDPAALAKHPRMTAPLSDQRKRALRDLRISVTDRCNLRCHYCMPADVFHPGYAFLPRQEILRYEAPSPVQAQMPVEL